MTVQSIAHRFVLTQSTLVHSPLIHRLVFIGFNLKTIELSQRDG